MTSTSFAPRVSHLFRQAAAFAVAAAVTLVPTLATAPSADAAGAADVNWAWAAAGERLGDLTAIDIDKNLEGTVTVPAFPGATAQDGVRIVGQTLSDAGNVNGWQKGRVASNITSFDSAGIDPSQPLEITVLSGPMNTPVNTGKVQFLIGVALVKGGAADINIPDTEALPAQAPYYSSLINPVDTDGDGWPNSFEIVSDGGSGTEKTDTTTTLTASNVAETSLTLAASGLPSDATGTVQFKNGDANIGEAVAVSGGGASVPVTGLAAGTEYSFSVVYSGDNKYNGSTGTVQATTTAPTVIDSSDSNVNVSVPNETTDEPGDLTISVKPGASIPLTGPTDRPAGEDWQATGTLGNVTVNDDRRTADGKAWSLNGKLQGAFTSGDNSIAATAFGWTPKKVNGNGTQGDAATDFTKEHALGTGSASAEANQQSTFDADLQLTVPSGTAGGDYTSTLTLTLI